mgnify:FL=1
MQNKIKIGAKIKMNVIETKYTDTTKKSRIVTGTVTEVYPTFVLIDLGKYKVCAYIRDLNNCASIAI